MYLNDKLMNAESELETVTEVEKERQKSSSITPDCLTPFIRHSFVDCPNRSNRIVPGDVSQSGKRCQTCALVVAKTQLDTPQREGSNQVAVQEITDSDKKEDSQSKASRQGSGHPRSRMSINKISDSALTQPCFVPSLSNPSEAQKYAHIWKARVDEIVCKRRAVSGILKREKVTNLLTKNSEWSSPSFLPSPVKDARFLGLQSLLVPVSNNMGAYNGKVERSWRTLSAKRETRRPLFSIRERERTLGTRLVTRNRPFRNCPKPLFQSEAKGEAIDMQIRFDSHANKTYFHLFGFALSLVSWVWKVRASFATRKWPTEEGGLFWGATVCSNVVHVQPSA